MRHDLRLALRKLRLQPGFSLVVVTTLALGIGASAAIFSIVDGVLLNPLPYPDPGRLVLVRSDFPAQGTTPPLAPPELPDVQREVSALESVGAIWYRPAALTDDAGEPEDIDMGFVSAGFLPTLGVVPMLGRVPLAQEDIDGNEPVIVLSEHLWRRRYGSDPDIVGKRIEMDDQPHTVVGVMPAGFRAHLPGDVGSPASVDAWVTFGGGYEQFNRNFRVFTLLGRLHPAASHTQASEQLATLAASLRAEHAGYGGTGLQLRAERLDVSLTAPARRLLSLLLAAVGLVLLIVCANVANLYLSRAAEARRDVAVRRALGATGAGLLRSLLVECLVVTGLGAAGGIAVAYWAIATLTRLAPAELPRVQDASLDLRVLAVAGAIAVFTALLFAAVSTVEMGRRSTSPSRAGSRASEGRTSKRLRSSLLVVELSLSLVLMVSVGLMVRSFGNLAEVDLGFDPAGVTTMEMSLVDTHFSYREPRKIADFYAEVSRQVAAVPGVEAAGITTYLPTRRMSLSPYAHEAGGGTTEWGALAADRRHVTPGWMEAMGLRLLSGRFFDWSDDLEHPNVVIVDEVLADRLWPDGNAVGQRLRVAVFIDATTTSVWAEVVGVVQHVRHDPTREGVEQIYIPHGQSPMRTTVLTVRADGDMPGLGAAVGSIVRRLDGDQPVGAPVAMARHLDATLATRRFAFNLLAVFSGLALVLAVIGTYAVISYSVTQRRREIGIRMAVGASPAQVVRAIVASGSRLAVIGIAAGLGGALFTARFLADLLYGVSPTDPATLATLSVLLAAVALAACWLPARRAARLDPTTVLRSE